MTNRCIIVVDYQFDFASPKGTLYVKDGETLQEKINTVTRTQKQQGAFIIVSRDWHPAKHSSFLEYGGQWPAHCVAGLGGAELYFEDDYVDMVINKGKDTAQDEYSCIINGRIRDFVLSFDEVYIFGLAGDFCVKNTILSLVDKDNLENNKKLFFVEGLTKDVFPQKHTELIRELASYNINIINSL